MILHHFLQVSVALSVALCWCKILALEDLIESVFEFCHEWSQPAYVHSRSTSEFITFPGLCTL